MTKEQLKQTNLDEILLIDIRTVEEISAIPSPAGAKHIPMQTVVKDVNSGIFPKDKKIITICHSGGRCMMLHQFLLEHNYQADYLEGGILVLNEQS